MSLVNLPVSVFDLALITVLAAGLFSGRKHGMSIELLDLLKWLAILVGGSAVYALAGEELARFSRFFGLLFCYIAAYLGTALAIWLLFTFLKRSMGGKLVGSDIFGRAEYYLGMISGVLRHGCMLLAALALLNARLFNPMEVRAMEKFQNDELGSDFFPTLYSVQHMVFERSIMGSWIKRNLGFLLIKRTEPDRRRPQPQEANVPY